MYFVVLVEKNLHSGISRQYTERDLRCVEASVFRGIGAERSMGDGISGDHSLLYIRYI